jgi:hypothetical protein
MILPISARTRLSCDVASWRAVSGCTDLFYLRPEGLPALQLGKPHNTRRRPPPSRRSLRQCRIVKRVIAEVVSLPGYESRVSALLDEEERMAMEFFIACAPEDHPVMPGAGGFRKARWARRGRGKSSGSRVIYFFLAKPGRIYMAGIYAKSRRETLSSADQNVLEKLAAQIKRAAKGG